MLIATFTFGNLSLFATEAHTDEAHEEKPFDAVEVIMHHIADAHEFHILDYTDDLGVEHPVSIPLPVILYTDGNFDVFMSNEFNHGDSEVVRDDRTYKLDHGHIVELNGGHPIDFSITKNVFSMFLSILIILLLFISAGRSYRNGRLAPSGLASFIEPLVLFVRDDIVKPNLGHNYKKFLPYLLTLFFFILVNNFTCFKYLIKF